MIRLENVLKRSWRCIEYVLARCLEGVFKTSWRRLEDVLKTFWERFELSKTYGQDQYIALDQDVLKTSSADVWLSRVLMKTSWRRLLKTKTKDVFKTSSRRLHQDECLLDDILWSQISKYLGWGIELLVIEPFSKINNLGERSYESET